MSGAPETPRTLRLGVLISGAGSTLANLIECIRDGRLLDARIELVLSSRGDAAGVALARDAGLAVDVVRPRDFMERRRFHDALNEAFEGVGVDLVVMAGFLCYWRLPSRLAGRVLNIHPALLPEFGGQGMYGRRVHEAVLAAGCSMSGCTVHLVDNQYDHGPIVAQRRVGVEAGDTPDALAARVQRAERRLYPEVIQQVATHGVGWLSQFGHVNLGTTGAGA